MNRMEADSRLNENQHTGTCHDLLVFIFHKVDRGPGHASYEAVHN